MSITFEYIRERNRRKGIIIIKNIPIFANFDNPIKN